MGAQKHSYQRNGYSFRSVSHNKKKAGAKILGPQFSTHALFLCITGAILFVPFLVKNAVSFFSVPKLPSLCKSPGTGATAKVKLSFRARHKWN